MLNTFVPKIVLFMCGKIWQRQPDSQLRRKNAIYLPGYKNTNMHTQCRLSINYRRISLLHNMSRKYRKVVKFVSITHSERNIWNGPTVATAISREKCKPVLE
jgi:hypothetical protein